MFVQQERETAIRSFFQALTLRSAFAWITGLTVTLVALLTASPGLAWLDAGDFTTAAATLGVPHPTGFPLYVLLGHFSTLLPLGNIAARLAWESALFSGVAAGLGVFVVERRFGRRAAVYSALSLVLAFQSVTTLFESARVAEVYSLHLALFVGAITCLERLEATRDLRFYYVFMFVLGLGISNHALFRPIAVVLFLGSFFVSQTRTIRVVLIGIGFCFSALACFAYLPLAALRAPAHNWGNPVTLKAFWHHVTATEVLDAFSSQHAWDKTSVLFNSERFALQLWDGMGSLCVLGGILLVGFPATRLFLLSQKKAAFDPILVGTIVLLAICTGEWAYSVLINPMGLRDHQNGQINAIVLPIVAATGLAMFFERIILPRIRPFLRLPLHVLFILIVILGMVPRFMDERWGIQSDWGAEDLAAVHMSYAEPGSLTTLASDSMIAGHLYLDVALGARPDAVFIGRNQMANGVRFAYTSSHQPFPLVSEETLERWSKEYITGDSNAFEERVGTMLSQHYGVREIYWEPSWPNADLPKKYTLEQHWPLGIIRDTSGSSSNCLPEERSYCSEDPDVAWGVSARSVRGAKMPSYSAWLASQWGFWGRAQYKNGQYLHAATTYEKATKLAPTSLSLKTSFAVSLAALGQRREALTLVREVVEENPLSRVAIRNGLLYSEQLKEEEQYRWFKEKALSAGLSIQDK